MLRCERPPVLEFRSVEARGGLVVCVLESAEGVGGAPGLTGVGEDLEDEAEGVWPRLVVVETLANVENLYGYQYDEEYLNC